MRYLLRTFIILTAIAFPALVAGALSPERPVEVSERIAETERAQTATLPGPGYAQLAVLRTEQVAETPTPEPVPDPTAPPAPAPDPEPVTAQPEPTPAPTPTPTPATPPPNSDYDPQDVRNRVHETWTSLGGNGDEAVELVRCETGGSFNPRAHNPAGPYHGLFQFHQSTWERNGGSGDPRDASPEQQTRVGWNLYTEKGWSPWPSCRPD